MEKFILGANRAPTLLQMRVLGMCAVGTWGVELEYMYLALYGEKAAYGTIFGAINTMRNRGWLKRHEGRDNKTWRRYSITPSGAQAYVRGQKLYKSAIEGEKIRNRTKTLHMGTV